MQTNNAAIIENPPEDIQAALSVKLAPAPDNGDCPSCRPLYQLPEAVRQAIFNLIKAAIASA